MTFAISKELQFLAVSGFRVKLTPMSNAKPLQKNYLDRDFSSRKCDRKFVDTTHYQDSEILPLALSDSPKDREMQS